MDLGQKNRREGGGKVFSGSAQICERSILITIAKEIAQNIGKVGRIIARNKKLNNG